MKVISWTLYLLLGLTALIQVGEGVVDPLSTVVRVEVGESPGGVRFAAKTSREDTRRATSDTMRMGNPDWVPARRTLAESLRF